MDADKFREAYRRLQTLEERYPHKLRPRRRVSLAPPSLREVEQQQRELAEYTLELEQVVRGLFLAIAGRPGGDAPKEAP